MKFEDYQLAEAVHNSIATLGYKKPTDIQFRSIPAILKGEDVLAIAQTGTGKTAAFVIPIVNNIHIRKSSSRAYGVKCLVMAPTHELALQIESVFKNIGRNTKVQSYCVYGGVEQDPQIKKLNKGVDIVVATPGRLFDLVSQKHLDLSHVEMLVLDEADHMLDLGFIKDIRDLMRLIPKKRQTLFFSATINEEIKKLAYSLVTNAIRIQISPKDPVAKNITHSVAFIDMDDKRFFLESLINYNEDNKILIFVRTKVRAERVKSAMERVGIVTDTIHSDKTQEERSRTMASFRKGELMILIATDISARGIDVPNVDFVINYDLPDSSEQYVHRVGRTGRGTQKGKAISFCAKEEKEMLAEIETNLDKPIDRHEISKEDYKYTVAVTEDQSKDWRKLLKENEKLQEDIKALKKKRRKK
jgi:ATP-dependent RNA helicase RhlE